MRIPAISAVFVAASVLTGCIVGDELPDEEAGETETGIVGGTVDPGDPAVGLLRTVKKIDATGKPLAWGVCTATLIAPRIMVTAAHCNAVGLWTDVQFGTQPANGGLGSAALATVVVSPLWNGDPEAGHDVAIVLLSTAIATTPIRRAATPGVGAAVRAVGYGQSQLDGNGIGTGTKRQITFPVTAVDAHELAAGSEGHNVCYGDSGGPVFSGLGITGINSYVDGVGCHGGGHFMRLDDNLPFIRQYVPSF